MNFVAQYDGLLVVQCRHEKRCRLFKANLLAGIFCENLEKIC